MKTTSTKILVTVEESGNKTNELGLTLPDSLGMQGIEKAKVLYSGDEVENVGENDILYIYKGSGTKFIDPEDNKEYRVISITDIIVIK